MPTCLLANNFGNWPLMRQTPGSTGRWGEWQFTEGMKPGRYDACVVYEGLPAPLEVEVPQGNTYFVSGEPPTIRRYRRMELAQYGHVLTCHDSVRHRGRVLGQTALPWHVGVDCDRGNAARWDYDSLARVQPDAYKRNLIAVVCSDKEISPQHRQRRELVARLKAIFGNRLDVFGRGVRPISDKWEAVGSYQYAVVIENCIHRHYLTEKLTDALLAGCFSLYAGCPNVADYVPADALAPIPLDDAERAAEIIRRTIDQDLYSQRRDAIEEARACALNELNLFPTLTRWLDRTASTGPVRRITLWPGKCRFRLAAKHLRRPIAAARHRLAA